MDKESKKVFKKNDKKIYIILCIVLILWNIINFLYYIGSHQIASGNWIFILNIIIAFGLMATNIWYALRVNISIFWSLVLGFVALWPGMSLVPFIILLLRKSGTK